jgi:hypothetical protein
MFGGQGEPTPTFVLALKIIICGWAFKKSSILYPYMSHVGLLSVFWFFS